MVMRNNRCYHQELMEVQRMCNRMNRGIEQRAHRQRHQRPEHRLRQARAEHVASTREGPIENPKDLGPALQAGRRRRQAWRTGGGRRGHATPVKHELYAHLTRR